MTGKQSKRSDRSGWWFAIAAVPILCCAGPAVLAALGAGGVAFGSTSGNLAVAVIGVLVAALGLLSFLRRRGRSKT